MGAALAMGIGGWLGNGAETAASGFTDVPASYWASDEIGYLTGKGIVNGYPDGRFGLNDTVTRGQAAAIIANALELNLTNVPEPGFSDISPSYRFYPHIAAATAAGIFAHAESFNPNGKLTRGQMAIVLSKAYDLPNTIQADFKDTSPRQRTYTAVQALAGSAVTVGYPDLTFRPDEELTRTQFAVFMARTMENKFKPAVSVVPQLLAEGVYFPYFVSPATPLKAEMMNSAIAAKRTEAVQAYEDFHADDLGEMDYGLSYSVQANNGEYISVLLNEYFYEGGAHGLYFLTALNFEADGSRIPDLSSFLGSGAAAAEPILEREVRDVLADYEPLLYPFEGIDLETQMYYIKDDAIVLYYGLYEYTPYAAGIPEIPVPFSGFR